MGMRRWRIRRDKDRGRIHVHTRSWPRFAWALAGLWKNGRINKRTVPDYISRRRRESLDVVIYLWAAAPCDIYLRLGLER